MGYRLQYSEIQADSQTDARGLERGLLMRSILMMQEAMAEPQSHLKAVEARHFSNKIWTPCFRTSLRPTTSCQTKPGLDLFQSESGFFANWSRSEMRNQLPSKTWLRLPA